MVFQIVNLLQGSVNIKNFIKIRSYYYARFRIKFCSLLKVDPGGGGGAQYCRLVCTQGAWRGPYCSHTPEHLDTNTRGQCAALQRLQSHLIITAGSLHKAGCRLDPVPPELEVRLGHTVLAPGVSLGHGDTVLVRCSDPSHSMAGQHTITCADGAWSHAWPACVPTYPEFDGESGCQDVIIAEC